MSYEFIQPGQPIDLSNCEKEPIHIPGSIQPEGYILAFNSEDRVCSYSENLDQVFHDASSKLLGASIQDLPTVLKEICEPLLLIKKESGAISKVEVMGNKYVCHLWPFQNGVSIFEFEKDFFDVDFETLNIFNNKLPEISISKDSVEISQTLAVAIKTLTGYDRVMIYQFHEDWSGEVIAESCNKGLEEFLGLHYPAGDIPAQARKLYLANLSRIIADVDYTPVPLMGEAHIDLSPTRFRSISPMHIQYMKNMGVRATFVISIVIDGKLWGLVACHHYSGPKTISHLKRSFSVHAAKLASLAISAQARIELLNQLDQQKKMASRLIQEGIFNQPQKTPESLVAELLSITRSSGAIICNEFGVHKLGLTPDDHFLESFITWARDHYSSDRFFLTSCLGSLYEPARGQTQTASGVLVIPLGARHMGSNDSNLIVFFRPEFVYTVNWAGNPDKAVEVVGDTLSPRRSFALWKQQKVGTSRPWEDRDLQAARALQAEYLKATVQSLLNRKREAELRLMQVERMSVIGGLVAGVAHDFNNVLQGIQAVVNTTILSGVSDPVKSGLGKVKTFTDRGASLVRHLLNYSRSNPSDYTAVNAVELVEESYIFAKALAPQAIEINLEIDPTKEGLRFFGSHQEILQCIINLITNARDAMADHGGVLTISLREFLPEAAKAQSLDLEPSQQYVRIAVSDTGSGISPENLDRIFDPFYSTKSQSGQGTGLGLANVQQIVKANGGKLVVESKLNEGSNFSFFFPKLKNSDEAAKVVQAKVEEALVLEDAHFGQFLHIHVLYVEDDTEIREIHSEAFAGYFAKITSVANGQEALDKIQKTDGPPFDLIISDFRMPVLDGLSLYRNIRAQGLQTPFILATGELFVDNETKAPVDDPLFKVVNKPFDFQEILKVSKELLAKIPTP